LAFASDNQDQHRRNPFVGVGFARKDLALHVVVALRVVVVETRGEAARRSYSSRLE
jgi:hypothetical protein